MLPKASRLTTKTFQRVFQRSKRWRGKNTLFLYSPTRQEPHFGVSVSKKKIKLAVGRNKVRRVLYAFYRQYFYKNKPPFNIICLYNPSTDLQDIRVLEKDFAEFKSFLKNKK